MKNKPRHICYCKPDRHGLRWVENPTHGLRFVGYADAIATNIRHQGWYTDDCQDDTYRGVVYRLPARNGVEQFVPGYVASWDDTGSCLDFTSIDDNEISAAHQADGLAQAYAEREIEYRNRVETHPYDDDAEAAFDGERDDDGMLQTSLMICSTPSSSEEDERPW